MTPTKIRPRKPSTENDKRALDFAARLLYRPGSSLRGEVAEAVSSRQGSDAWVAQLVEQRIENPRVAGSIPAPGTTFLLPFRGLLTSPASWRRLAVGRRLFAPRRYRRRRQTPLLPKRRAPFFIDHCFVALLRCSIANLLARGKTPRFPENPFVRRGKWRGRRACTTILCPNEPLDGAKRGCQRTTAAILTLR